MSLIVDFLLLGASDFFRDSPEKRQRRAFKNRKAIAEAKKRSEDTGLAYIILDDLGRRVEGDLPYQEPPTEDFHCEDDGPDW